MSVFTVVTFLILLLFVGLAVDVGILLRYRRAMQNACDAGVLAGSLNLRRAPDTAAPTAERYATSNMVQNAVSWTTLEATVYDKNWQATLTDADRVRMEIHMDVPTFFFRILVETVHVAVSCAAKLTPVILTKGLVPIGLNYPLYEAQLPCQEYYWLPLGDPGRPPQCQTFDLTIDISDKTNPWGSGNTGLLSMGCFDCPAGGGSQWKEYFINGAPTQYCWDMNRTTDVMMGGYPSGAPDLCANVRTETGVKIGPISQGIAARCAYPAPPDSLERIIMMPLLNPQYIEGGQGNYTTEIWGYAAFQIDCSKTKFTGADPTMYGGFVEIVSMQAYGTETEFDTGVYTVKLIQ